MEEALNAIETLKGLDLKESTYKEVLELVKKIGNYFPASLVRLRASQSIYRARFHKEDEMFFFEQDLKYRPDALNVRNHGRANPAQSTAFYGSISTKSVQEGYLISAQEGSHLMRNNKNGVETATIGKWNLKKDMFVVANLGC